MGHRTFIPSQQDQRLSKEKAGPAASPETRTPGDAVVELRDVGTSLGGNIILEDVNLSVHRGETIAIIGPSGAGKTTLLRCINFLIPYQQGRIYVENELVGYREADGGTLQPRREREINRQRGRIGFVFQRLNLFPHRTALDNIIEGPIHALKIRREVAVERARKALARVGLEEKADRYPSELSGGEQQRVAIARALCMEPAVILFDEVTSALDPELVVEVLAVMRQLASDGTTMIVVTHELRFARRGADRILFMEAGRVIADTPTIPFFESPPSERIEAYLSHFND
jgi:ABC-type polar amino acid transport system ATPase subunit